MTEATAPYGVLDESNSTWEHVLQYWGAKSQYFPIESRVRVNPGRRISDDEDGRQNADH